MPRALQLESHWNHWKSTEGLNVPQTINIAIKVILLLLGSTMLFGGGICVATNIFFAGTGAFDSVILLLLAISVLVAWIGWWLLKRARSIGVSSTDVNEDNI